MKEFTYLQSFNKFLESKAQNFNLAELPWVEWDATFEYVFFFSPSSSLKFQGPWNSEMQRVSYKSYKRYVCMWHNSVRKSVLEKSETKFQCAIWKGHSKKITMFWTWLINFSKNLYKKLLILFVYYVIKYPT